MNAVDIEMWSRIRRRQAMYRYAAVRAKLARLAKHIQAGGSASDPGYDEDYRYLVSEIGEEAFNSEIQGLLLRTEGGGNG